MAKNSDKKQQTRLATNPQSIPSVGNHSDEEVEGVLGLPEIREFCTETAGNFATLINDTNELSECVGDLKIGMDEAEPRIAQNVDHEINLTKVLVHNLRKQNVRMLKVVPEGTI